MSWTPERVEILKKMWSEGQSASQVAGELGGVTRNAVIGKVHRLGLSNRGTVASKEHELEGNKEGLKTLKATKKLMADKKISKQPSKPNIVKEMSRINSESQKKGLGKPPFQSTNKSIIFTANQ